MKAIILSCVAFVALCVWTYNTIQKRKFALEAMRLSDEELAKAIADLWIITETKFSPMMMIKLHIFTREASRREQA